MAALLAKELATTCAHSPTVSVVSSKYGRVAVFNNIGNKWKWIFQLEGRPELPREMFGVHVKDKKHVATLFFYDYKSSIIFSTNTLLCVMGGQCSYRFWKHGVFPMYTFAQIRRIFLPSFYFLCLQNEWLSSLVNWVVKIRDLFVPCIERAGW